MLITTCIALSLLLIATYCVYVRNMRKYWRSAQHAMAPAEDEGNVHITVLVPFRNEGQHLPALIEDLSRQDYNQTRWEVIFIDDDSQDNGAEIVRQAGTRNKNVRLLSSTSPGGKKAALKTGIENSTSELLITIDADVKLQPRWLSTIAIFYNRHKPAMIILPVLFSEGNNLFERLQSLEFLSLAAITGASAGKGHATMCNGANLGIARASFFSTDGYASHEHISSGDDMFMMTSLKRKNRRDVKYLLSKNVIAETSQCKTIPEFIAQRVRWTSKASAYRDADVIISASLVLVVNVGVLFLVVIAFFSEAWRMTIALALMVKFITDYSLLSEAGEAMGKRIRITEALLLELIYPFYALVIPLIAIFYRPIWKGRRISLRNQ